MAFAGRLDVMCERERRKMGWGFASVVEHLPAMRKALGAQEKDRQRDKDDDVIEILKYVEGWNSHQS